MRTLFRQWLLYLLSLYVLDRLCTWIRIDTAHALVLSASAFFILQTIGKPILKILWLPINILTLGLFSWVLSVVIVFLVVFFIPGFHVTGFALQRLALFGYSIPEIHLKIFWTYLLFSIILSWMIGFLHWLLIDSSK